MGGRPSRPATAAEERAAEVRARRGATGDRGPIAERRAEPPPWERETWVDEGPLREVAQSAVERGANQIDGGMSRVRRQGDLDPVVVAEIRRDAGAAKAERLQERLLSAAEALERGRYSDARRMVQPVLRDLPDLAMGHEVAGLAWYASGQWRKAAAELEMARLLEQTVRLHAVLADCYRALRRYETVAELWAELRAASPSQDLLAEGRIVAAGALADQGRLRDAIAMFDRQRRLPAKPREHHLRQWYVLGDLCDRAGDIVEARRWFGIVASVDAEFADVVDRLRTLGR